MHRTAGTRRHDTRRPGCGGKGRKAPGIIGISPYVFRFMSRRVCLCAVLWDDDARLDSTDRPSDRATAVLLHTLNRIVSDDAKPQTSFVVVVGVVIDGEQCPPTDRPTAFPPSTRHGPQPKNAPPSDFNQFSYLFLSFFVTLVTTSL